MIGLELRDVSKTFARSITGINGVDLTVLAGELVAIVGPSGSGKSTLLRTISGLDVLDRGEIRIGGERIENRPPRERKIALVFQNQAPYPYLNVFDNLAFGLRARHRSKAEIHDRATEVASALGLTNLLDRRPSALSGGEKQRVALGRALASRPELLLLDEPFSNLDTPLRTLLRRDLLAWQRRLKITTLIVTHDQGEALAIGDRVAVMDQGKIVQIGSPREVYDQPATRFVAEFVGSPPMNIVSAEIKTEGNIAWLRLLGTNPLAASILAIAPSPPHLIEPAPPRPISLGIRPEHVLIHESEIDNGNERRLLVACVVEHQEFRGDHAIATLRSGSVELLARCELSRIFSPGTAVVAELDLTRSIAFDPNSGLRIDQDGPRLVSPA